MTGSCQRDSVTKCTILNDVTDFWSLGYINNQSQQSNDNKLIIHIHNSKMPMNKRPFFLSDPLRIGLV